jgi:hypothetical protein
VDYVLDDRGDEWQRKGATLSDKTARQEFRAPDIGRSFMAPLPVPWVGGAVL